LLEHFSLAKKFVFLLYEYMEFETTTKVLYTITDKVIRLYG